MPGPTQPARSDTAPQTYIQQGRELIETMNEVSLSGVEVTPNDLLKVNPQMSASDPVCDAKVSEISNSDSYNHVSKETQAQWEALKAAAPKAKSAPSKPVKTKPAAASSDWQAKVNEQRGRDLPELEKTLARLKAKNPSAKNSPEVSKDN